MHREISHADQAFGRQSNLTLYVLTTFVGLVLGVHFWPDLVRMIGGTAWLPTWPQTVFGYKIALIAALIGLARILFTTLDSLLQGRFGADLALAIAAIAAIVLDRPEVAAEIVFIGLLGECLESITFERTQRALRQLVEVCPRRCWLLRDGQEVRVLVQELRVGDRVVVKPGARVPVDGVIVEGRSAVDVSALTGESLPVDKAPGDKALAGSLNGHGALIVETHQVAEHTVVGQVIELTARALKDKAPLERTADRLARYFLPVVLSLAALTCMVGLVVHGFSRVAIFPALSVLVVACPCALILATPAAVIAALGRLAGTGILLKGGSALERLAGVRAFAFDKTGTLTEGKLELGDIVVLSGGMLSTAAVSTTHPSNLPTAAVESMAHISALDDGNANALLALAATAEQRSEHVLARLLVHQAAARGLTLGGVDEFLAHPGAGVTARTTSGSVVVGTRRFVEGQGIAVPPAALAALEQLDAHGQTALLVADNNVVVGVIGARDRVRPQAAEVLAELRTLGIQRLAMLTGDRAAAARSVASQLGIEEVHAELLPAQKAEFVARGVGWAESSRPTVLPNTLSAALAVGLEDSAHPTALSAHAVAFVGDGINDAPALARATVGLAVGGIGADVAAEAGDIVLMADPLRPLPLLLRLSREMVRIIRQNIIVFAFGVNAVGIVLTAWLWPLVAPKGWWYEQGPVAAVIYHQFGSLAVLLNSMRLLWFERTATNSVVRQGRQAVQSLDSWVQHYLDPDDWLHSLSHHWKLVTLAIGMVVLLLYALSGLEAVGPDEVAVVRRFGRLLDDDLQPGLHYCWPWPVEEIVRVQTDKVQTLEIGFRSARAHADSPDELAWASPHGGDGIQRMEEEAVMITGDGNLVELQASVRYSVKDPRVFLFEVNDAALVLRSVAEAILRETVAGRSFDELLTVNREQFQKEVFNRLSLRCAGYGQKGLGIQVEGIALRDLHPPWEVVAAYHDVTKAMEMRDRALNEAEALAIRKRREAQANVVHTIRQAESAKNQRIQNAESERTVFLARLRTRTHLSLAQQWGLLYPTLQAIARGQEPKAAWADYDHRRMEALTAQAALTDFRLFWNVLGEILSGREKLLIDAERVNGRRNLFLFDPDASRVPIPLMNAPERAPPRGKSEMNMGK